MLVSTTSSWIISRGGKKKHGDAQGGQILVYSGSFILMYPTGTCVNLWITGALCWDCVLSVHCMSSWSWSLSCDVRLSLELLSKNSSHVMSLSSIVLFLLADMPKNLTYTLDMSPRDLYSLLAGLAVCNWLQATLWTKWASSFIAVV